MELECSFSFRSLECKSSFRKLGLECMSVHRKIYHRLRGLVSKFFFRKLELECSFSFRSLECKSSFRKLGLECMSVLRKFYLRRLELVSRFSFHKLGLECSFPFRSLGCKSSYRRLGLGCRCDHRKFFLRRSCHRMEHIRFFFVGLGRIQFFFVGGCSVGLERNQFFFVGGCSNLYRPFVALGRTRWPFVGLGCSVGRMVGRRHLSSVVGCSKYRFLFWLLVLVRIELLCLLLVSLDVGHLVRQFLRRDWQMGFQGKVPRMRTKSKR